MECNVFTKKLLDLIEDNISYDMKKAMLEHMNTCEACRSQYKEELLIGETFKNGLYVAPESFRSLRSDIIKNIDKKKYGKSPIKRLLTYLRRYKGTYTALAAVTVSMFFIIPYISRNGLIDSMKESFNINTENIVSSVPKDSTGEREIVEEKPETDLKSDAGLKEAAAAKNDNLKKDVPSNSSDIKYVPKFSKKVLDKSFAASFHIPWEDSLNKKYSVTVEGKGEEAIEEGVASIILKKLDTGEQWSFDLIDNDKKQYSPKKIKWIDNENLLVTVGFGNGRVELGGFLYILNINSSQVTEADPNNNADLSEYAKITKIFSVKTLSSKELEIEVEVLVYEDESKNNNHTENRTIKIPFNKLKS